MTESGGWGENPRSIPRIFFEFGQYWQLMASLWEFLIVGGVAALATLLLTPLTRRLAVRVGATASPSARKVHESETPSLGGLAMLGGVGAGLLTAWTMGTFDAVFRSFTDIAGVALAALIIFAVGVADDIREVSAPAKVAGIVLSGTSSPSPASRFCGSVCRSLGSCNCRPTSRLLSRWCGCW